MGEEEEVEEGRKEGCRNKGGEVRVRVTEYWLRRSVFNCLLVILVFISSSTLMMGICCSQLRLTVR